MANRRIIWKHVVYGIGIGPRTECAHYGTPKDIVAIKLLCCDRYFSCIECHETLASHPVVRWPQGRWDESAVLCGNCGHEMTVRRYMASGSRCPNCSAEFNPGCERHWGDYFEM